MKIIEEKTYRNSESNIKYVDNMVRVTIDFSKREWFRLRGQLLKEEEQKEDLEFYKNYIEEFKSHYKDQEKGVVL